jgi:hypothetical protein
LKQISSLLKPHLPFVAFFFSLLQPILYFLWLSCDHVLKLLSVYEDILLQELQCPGVLVARRRCCETKLIFHI